MMTDNAKKFAEAVSKDEALRKELEALGACTYAGGGVGV